MLVCLVKIVFIRSFIFLDLLIYLNLIYSTRFLFSSRYLIPYPCNFVQVIVVELAPLFFNFPFELLPIAFNNIPVHFGFHQLCLIEMTI